ncbi:hypothetical protein [Acetanaerobacterium elongatum]|uniref:Uncharacterized protein n=1 Tax=Acetanaerobacterium elongatum TaxID=258515 RepID=A0A1G9Z2N0_9FIRM|nr:hypothetical protein [Acetanaerobacterium elongatum]SDN15590.1 hypothetical protein SAMN05192585_11271 [Acetanaerobacterium elongatum]
MPKLTTNLQLKKPLLDEAADIEVINENMDRIDAVIITKNSAQAIHHATACTGTGRRYELIVPTLDYPLPSDFILTFIPHVDVLDNAVVVIRKSAETPDEQSTVLPIITNANETVPAGSFKATTVTMLAIGGGRAFFKLGGIGKPPENWSFLQAITQTGQFLVEETGWYQIHVIGPGGNGGKGGTSVLSGDNSGLTYVMGGGGGGGSGGGLAISRLFLKAGTVINITVTASYVSFGSDITCTAGYAGQNGGNADINNVGAAGAGATNVGTAVGGNYINLPGKPGKNGVNGAKWGGTAPANQTIGGAGGAAGDPLTASKYYSSPKATSGMNAKTSDTANNIPFMFGGAGAGRTGGVIPSNAYYNSYPGTTYAGAAAGGGAPGGVVIEKGVA